MAIYAFRTSGDHQHPQYKVSLGNGQEIPDGPHVHRRDSPHVSLHFSIPVFPGQVGVERTQIFMIAIEPEAFTDLVRQMMKAHQQEAIRAFGKAMQDVQIPMPTEN